MSLVKEAWEALHTVATLIDKVEAADNQTRDLAKEVQALRERLVVVETIISLARQRALKHH
ncbi:MAG TPA: hypothetical protein VFE77_05745 [Rhodanobacter sp.]|nr:hypothetical protein [Rhodanobacter sp.]